MYSASFTRKPSLPHSLAVITYIAFNIAFLSIELNKSYNSRWTCHNLKRFLLTSAGRMISMFTGTNKPYKNLETTSFVS